LPSFLIHIFNCIFMNSNSFRFLFYNVVNYFTSKSARAL
jgi:hypothetical protein